MKIQNQGQFCQLFFKSSITCLNRLRILFLANSIWQQRLICIIHSIRLFLSTTAHDELHVYFWKISAQKRVVPMLTTIEISDKHTSHSFILSHKYKRQKSQNDKAYYFKFGCDYLHFFATAIIVDKHSSSLAPAIERIFGCVTIFFNSSACLLLLAAICPI